MLQLQRTKRPCIGIVAECASPPQKAEQGTQRASAKAWVIEYARGVLCLLAHVSSLSSWDFRVFFSRGNTQASLPTTTIVAYKEGRKKMVEDDGPDSWQSGKLNLPKHIRIWYSIQHFDHVQTRHRPNPRNRKKRRVVTCKLVRMQCHRRCSEVNGH